jgi:hypothetical protein
LPGVLSIGSILILVNYTDLYTSPRPSMPTKGLKLPVYEALSY